MRWLFGGLVLTLLALIASAAEPEMVTSSDGRFVLRSGGFLAVFRFAEMTPQTPPAAAASRFLSVPGVLLPASKWTSPQGASASLDLCLVRHQELLGDESLAAARLHFTNASNRPFTTTLAVALTPAGAIHALAFEKHAFLIEGHPVLVADTPSRGAILADSPFAARPLSPQDQAHVESAKGECRGEMIFDLTVAPGQTLTLGFICPLERAGSDARGLDFYRALSVDDLFAEVEKQRGPH
jgi:hypothetical protein